MPPSFLDLHRCLRRLDARAIHVLHAELAAGRTGPRARARADYVLDKVLAYLPREARDAPARRVNALIRMLRYSASTRYEQRALDVLCRVAWLQVHAHAVEQTLVSMGPGITGRLIERLRPHNEPKMARSTFEACLRALVRLEEVSAVPVILDNLDARPRGQRAMLRALEELTAREPALRAEVRAVVRQRASAACPALEQRFWPALARGDMSRFRLELIRGRYRSALRRFAARDRSTGPRRGPNARPNKLGHRRSAHSR
ncbi:MAG: hypothetical protein ACOC1F_02805 [Myxococcota bacterium]